MHRLDGEHSACCLVLGDVYCGLPWQKRIDRTCISARCGSKATKCGILCTFSHQSTWKNILVTSAYLCCRKQKCYMLSLLQLVKNLRMFLFREFLCFRSQSHSRKEMSLNQRWQRRWPQPQMLPAPSCYPGKDKNERMSADHAPRCWYHAHHM
jgi:hypothetical protein